MSIIKHLNLLLASTKALIDKFGRRPPVLGSGKTEPGTEPRRQWLGRLISTWQGFPNSPKKQLCEYCGRWCKRIRRGQETATYECKGCRKLNGATYTWHVPLRR